MSRVMKTSRYTSRIGFFFILLHTIRFFLFFSIFPVRVHLGQQKATRQNNIFGAWFVRGLCRENSSEEKEKRDGLFFLHVSNRECSNFTYRSTNVNLFHNNVFTRATKNTSEAILLQPIQNKTRFSPTVYTDIK